MIMKILKNLPNRLHLTQEELEEEEEGAVRQDNSKREEEEVSVCLSLALSVFFNNDLNFLLVDSFSIVIL